MASNQKTTSSSQQRRPKTSGFKSFLACFGFVTTNSKTNNNNNNNNKPKKKSSDKKKKKKFSFKLRWPKLKFLKIIDKKKLFKYDARTAALKASHDIILEATKVHQRKKIDNHASKYITQKSSVLTKGSYNLKDIYNRPTNESNCVMCHKDDDHAILKFVKQPSFNNKVAKDSLLGALMMVAMLIIMSIWGRLCAILSMSALLYCIPLLRRNNSKVVTPIHTNDTKLDVVDFNSELYKKKVVLEGLLQRDHKNAVGIS